MTARCRISLLSGTSSLWTGYSAKDVGSMDGHLYRVVTIGLDGLVAVVMLTEDGDEALVTF